MLVRDKMTRDVITHHADQSLRMARNACASIAFAGRWSCGRKLAGIATDRDVRGRGRHRHLPRRPRAAPICSIASRWKR
jgi:hypothetical protein